MSNAQKTPLLKGLNNLARGQIDSALQLTGKALPASVVKVMGSIVTVKFELTKVTQTLPNVTVPVAGSEYVRLPIQAGTKGVVFPCDARIGSMSGLGAATADLSTPANLAALVFFPIGNNGWTAPEDPNYLELYGPNGVILKNKNKDFFIKILPTGVVISNKTGTVVATNDGIKWTFQGDVAVTGNITASGGVTAGSGGADQVTLQGHKHAANNTPPTPGF